MEYTLFFDESGNFNETSKMPSVVAGYLIEGPTPSESWAYSIVKEIKASNSMFDKINIDKYHGMNDFSESMQEFSVRVMERIKSEGARIISFQSKKSAKIVDGDVTYLNVFALGLVRFFEKLIVAEDVHKWVFTMSNRLKREAVVSCDDLRRTNLPCIRSPTRD